MYGTSVLKNTASLQRFIDTFENLAASQNVDRAIDFSFGSTRRTDKHDFSVPRLAVERLREPIDRLFKGHPEVLALEPPFKRPSGERHGRRHADRRTEFVSRFSGVKDLFGVALQIAGNRIGLGQVYERAIDHRNSARKPLHSCRGGSAASILNSVK